MNHRIPAFLSVLILLACNPNEVRPAQPEWKAGTASVALTPKSPMWMSGYASRTRPAEGKETDLFGKALALEDSRGTQLVIVTLDLIGVPRSLRKNLEKRCADAFKLPPEGLLL